MTVVYMETVLAIGNAGEVMSVVSDGASQVGGFLKGAGVFSVIGLLVVLAFKLGAVKILVIQEGETGLLIKRGRVAIDKKTGLPRIVNASRYQLHVAVVRHIAIVSNRERPLDLGEIKATIGGATWVIPLVLVWSIKGDAASMHNAVIKVSDGNRFDEKFGALEKMVKEQCIAGLASSFKLATSTKDGPPVISFDLSKDEVENRLAGYGSAFHQLLEAPAYRYGEQHQKDGLLEIAAAIQQSPSALQTHLSSVPSVS